MQEKIQHSRQKLEHIHENLGQMQAHLLAGQKTQAQLRGEIITINQRIVSTQRKLAGIQQRQHQAQTQIAELRAKINALQAELAQQKGILAQQLRAAYTLGGVTPLAVWLQTERPGELGRMNVFYESLAGTRSTLIIKTQGTAQQILKTKHEVQTHEMHLAQLARQVGAQEQTLQQQRRHQAALENQLASRIAADKSKISELQANANILDGLVGRLLVQFRHQEEVARAKAAAAAAEAQRKVEAEAAARRAAAIAARRQADEQHRLAQEKQAERRVRRAQETARAQQVQRAANAPKQLPSTVVHPPVIAAAPPPALPATPIVGHGNYPAPVSGPVSARFGAPRVTGGLNWQGITFQAAVGTPVRAIAPGMVLYAGPLRGYGQIVIVQIAHSLLAIYGHLGVTNVHVGQQISAGRPVGSVGSGGELGNDGLYFEMRNAGHPVNPLDYIHN
ncbi:peptidoglycan DD-metalloendopeptidase family protein [Acidithiobacillus sp.]|uniref:murein hydrolase activator EnvC family protein n=1 Tax=Acidithiobacillus sp. TaxID=1872118 RepID=UPI0025B9B378|nr:peptidoglycan DD-metalloendopeptidase family protein [Acidithiobacillus sp.]MCK9188637.1 peptidoglycan DD-metalloendopeptidase family protein [Acidithiobacillus sp.]MCK9360553.1 peptidoglycan DD-metalloendopeptidase family protein [Acidithiobacillus sp.]